MNRVVAHKQMRINTRKQLNTRKRPKGNDKAMKAMVSAEKANRGIEKLYLQSLVPFFLKKHFSGDEFPSLDLFFAYLTHRASRTYSTVLSKLSTEVLKLNLSFDRAERPLMYILRLAAMYIRCLWWWRKPCPCELMTNSSVCALQIVKINQDMNPPKLVSSNHTG